MLISCTKCGFVKLIERIACSLRGLVLSPCGKINVIMTLGGEGVLVHDVLQLHCQQILASVVIMHSCG